MLSLQANYNNLCAGVAGIGCFMIGKGFYDCKKNQTFKGNLEKIIGVSCIAIAGIATYVGNSEEDFSQYPTYRCYDERWDNHFNGDPVQLERLNRFNFFKQCLKGTSTLISQFSTDTWLKCLPNGKIVPV